jgi:Flp pilus assembly protein TadD
MLHARTFSRLALAPLVALAAACGGQTAVVKPTIDATTSASEGPETDPSAMASYERGLRALEDRNWSFAIAGFETATSIAPTFVEAWTNLSIALMATDRRGEALDAARVAYELAPDAVEVRYQLACALGAQAEFEEADALLWVLDGDALVGRDARLLRARHALLDGRPDDVFSILVAESEALDDADALNLLGVAAEHIQTDGDARAFYERALEIDSANLDALRNLAMLELRGDDDDRATELLSRFLEIAPADASDRSVVESRLNNLLEAN